jgi:hypothetical protein
LPVETYWNILKPTFTRNSHCHGWTPVSSNLNRKWQYRQQQRYGIHLKNPQEGIELNRIYQNSAKSKRQHSMTINDQSESIWESSMLTAKSRTSAAELPHLIFPLLQIGWPRTIPRSLVAQLRRDLRHRSERISKSLLNNMFFDLYLYLIY